MNTSQSDQSTVPDSAVNLILMACSKPGTNTQHNIFPYHRKLSDDFFIVAIFSSQLAQKDYYLPYYQMGVLLMEEKKNSLAEKFFKKSVKLMATSSAYIYLGNIFQKEKNYRLARDMYLKAIALAPYVPEAWNNVAVAEMKLRKYKSAYIHWKRYLLLEDSKKEKKIVEKNLRIIKEKFDF